MAFMIIWMIAREYRDIAGAGGVKDVVRELSEAFQRAGHDVTAVLPRYGFVKPDEMGFEPYGDQLEVDMDYASEERREKAGFWRNNINGVKIILVESGRFAEKLGIYTYTEDEEKADPAHVKGEGHYDYFAMNVLLQKAALALAMSLDIHPDVFHCHDGHAALLPALMRELEGMRHYFRSSRAVVTVHNAGIGYHQEVADIPFAKAITGLPQRVIYQSLLNGIFDPFLACAPYAVMNTVSENYARELQETELDALTGWLGHALSDRGVRFLGITNGINTSDFDPRHPEKLGLPAAFDPGRGDLSGKVACKRFLCELLRGKAVKDVIIHGILECRQSRPLITAINRFTEQKGIDVLSEALVMLLEEDRDFDTVILGEGKKEIEERLTGFAVRPDFKGRIAVLIGYDQKLANIIYGAGDFFVIPSLYEPCGLTDFMAQLMGNIPIVRATGGLVKVRDGFNGFSYTENSASALLGAMKRALGVFRGPPEAVETIIENAVRNIYKNFTWDMVKNRYAELYSGQI